MGLKYGTKLTHAHKLGSGSGYSPRWVTLFCIVSFCLGVIFINRFGISPVQIETDEASSSLGKSDVDCDDKDASVEAGDVFSQVSHTHDTIMTLDKTISSLEMQLASARSAKKPVSEASNERRKLFFVMGIMTAFSSRKRRDSIRETWMPQGKDLLRLEKEKGILIRFVIGHSHIKQNEKLWSTGEHVIRVESSLSGCLGLLISYCVSASKISSATSDGLLDNAIDVEDKQHQDFLRLNHVEGYHELSSKTQIYFSTVVAKWDADFYIKVDDDVHINLGMIGSTLNRHRLKPRVYIGCMKSGPVLAQKGVKYHEPEYWKFGEDGNKYFRHATGQIYVISRDLATYISVNRHMLHKYANEDVSLGSWFIGLDVEHIDDRSLCCQTPPDCEWKTQAGNMCAASFDWSCSGICKSVERMKDVHRLCGEDDEAIWHTSF